MAFAYVGDTDEEALRIGQKIAWFLTVSIKSAPQMAKFQPGNVAPEMAPAAWRAGASRRPRPTNLDAEVLIGQGQMFAGNPDTVARQIKDFRKRVGGIEHIIMMTRQGLVTHAEAEKSFTLCGEGGAAAIAGPAAGRSGRDRMSGAARGGEMSSVRPSTPTLTLPRQRARELARAASLLPSPAGGGGPGWGLGVSDTLRAGPLDLEVLRRGPTGADRRPILLVHGINPVSPKAPFLDMLAEHGEVIAPSMPGFGGSPRPEDFDTIYDLVHLWRDVLDAMPDRVAMIGFSFGGWIAAEVAVGGHPKLDRLVLVDPVGIKLGGREERDIVHFFNTNPAELNRRAWHDPGKRPDGVYGLGWQACIDEAMTDEEMVRLARNWDSLCLYAWRPHMYNPQLRHWLRRIAVPTLVLWGASDRIVTPEYGRRYAALIPGARFAADRGGRAPPGTRTAAGLCREVARFLGRRRMMFIVRSAGERPEMPGIVVKLSRDTPADRQGRGRKDRFLLRRRGRGDRGAARCRLAGRRIARRLLRGRAGRRRRDLGPGQILGNPQRTRLRSRKRSDRRRTPKPRLRIPSMSRSAARSSAPSTDEARAPTRSGNYRGSPRPGPSTGSQRGTSIRSRSSCPLLILLNSRQPSPFCRISTTWKR